MFNRQCLILMILSLLGPAPFSFGDDWPDWRGPNRDGISLEKGALSAWPPEEVWRAAVGLGYSAVAVSRGKAYVIGNIRGKDSRGVDTVYAFDAATGKVIWKHRYKCTTDRSDDQAAYSGPRATPVVDGDVVYTVSLEGWLFCLGAADGKVKWFQELNKYAFRDLPGLLYGYCSTPIIYKDKILCYLNGALMAFDKTTGKPLWRCKGGRPLWNGSSPSIAELGGKTCVVFGEDELVGADAVTGEKVWSHVLGRATVIAPIVVGNKVFYSSYPNRGACGVFSVSEADGSTKPVWANREIQNYHVGNPVLREGALYGVDCARTEYLTKDRKVSSLKCLDFETGKLKWKQKKIGWAQVVLVGDKLLVQREVGELILVEASPEAYKELGRVPLPQGIYWASPAIANGRVYCRSNKGIVVCLQTGQSPEKPLPAPPESDDPPALAPEPEKTEKDS